MWRALLCCVVVVWGCGGDRGGGPADDTAAGAGDVDVQRDDTAASADDTGATDSQTPTDDTAASGDDGDVVPTADFRPGRNPHEIVIVGSATHPLGLDLTARYVLPSGDGPFPACIVMHGSGGLFKEAALGEPCTDVIEDNFAAIEARLAGAGVAGLFPSSFYSRDARFCEDNSDFIQFAPDPYDREEKRTVLRLYDLQAAVDFLCARAEIDCERLCFVGTSNGASVILHYVADHLPSSFESFYAAEAALLDPIPYHPMRADRPLPRFAMAISPGCGFHGAIPFERDALDLPGTPADELYYPLARVHVQVGDTDTVPDHCTYEISGFAGTRQFQADEIASRNGLTSSSSPYQVDIYPGGGHDLVGSTTHGDTVLGLFSTLLERDL